MSARPRISLCIPTYNRAAYCQGALRSALKEAAAHQPGIVEVLVSDNASTDGTWEMITGLQAEHPGLRAVRNSENLGFDSNYLRCMEEARGEFVWIMGDDDEWLPGAVAQVLPELEAGADACLCLAEACDLDFNPVIVLPWYMDEHPPRVWHLGGRADLIRYFDACARNAGVFAFISVGILRRDRFLQNQDALNLGAGTGYPHLWGMMSFLLQPTLLHYIPEVLVRNRLSDMHADSNANKDLYGRWMHDLVVFYQIGDALFGGDLELQTAFSRIVGRNHHNTILPGLRECAPTEPSWEVAKRFLIRAGFSPIRIAAVDFSYQHLKKNRLPMPSLDPMSLCLVDLGLVVRGAKRVVVLALGGARNLLDGADVLAALRGVGEPGRALVFYADEGSGALDGFEVQRLDLGRYRVDEAYRVSILRVVADLSPELVVNLDPERGIEADDIMAAALPAGSIAFEPPPNGSDEALARPADCRYTRLVASQEGSKAMVNALDLALHET